MGIRKLTPEEKVLIREMGKDGFNDDGSHDATNGTDSKLGKEDYNNDNNHDTSNATNTTLERKGFGADNNWNE